MLLCHLIIDQKTYFCNMISPGACQIVPCPPDHTICLTFSLRPHSMVNRIRIHQFVATSRLALPSFAKLNASLLFFSLAFSDFRAFWVSKEFLVFLSVFPSFPRTYRVGRKILVFFRWFSLHMTPKKQGKDDQGWIHKWKEEEWMGQCHADRITS